MKKRIHAWGGMNSEEQSAILARPPVVDDTRFNDRVSSIIASVRRDGDKALSRFTRQFDGQEISNFKVTQQEFDTAEAELSIDASNAIDRAIANVRCFHRPQRPVDLDISIGPGIRCERRNQALDAVGLYVPAGTAPLPSTAIMLGVPATIAACPTAVMCTPAGPNCRVNSATLVAAQRSGISDVYKVGGAQAIAAMAYGTTSIPKVGKVFGPGNAWVTAAKQLVANDPDGASIDMPAGPSELLIIADESANPTFLAADLLSQAEHGIDSQVILITTNAGVAQQTFAEVEQQLSELPRMPIAKAALKHSHILLADSIKTAIEISNRYAPEHLILQMREPRGALRTIRNAGSVFLGHWSPESAGDYCSGTNHVLPTYGTATSHSGLGVEHFMRQMTVQELTKTGLQSLAPTVLELSALEGLDAHANSIRVRVQECSNVENLS